MGRIGVPDQAIEVTVLWFAALRERRGVAQERVRAAPGTTVGQLLDDLAGSEPRPTVAFALNRVRVDASARLAPGDEVAFLPPLGGG